jgi:hypothetical protein
MLYLFNSGFRSGYVGNVLATLALPTGWTNEYRYRAWGEIVHVDPASLEQLKKLKAGEPALVVFAERLETGYRYHPLRLAEFVRTYTKDDRQYVVVILKDYIYPRKLRQFEANLVSTFPQLPKFTGKVAELNDGKYVFHGASLVAQTSDFYSGEEAWVHVTTALAATTAFASSPAEQTLFLRYEVVHAGASTAPTIRRQGDASRYELVRDRKYELVTTYRYPYQATDPKATLVLKVGVDENLRLLGAADSVIGTGSDTHRVTMVSKKYLEDMTGHIHVTAAAPEPAAGQPTVKVLSADRALEVSIRDSVGFWVQIAIALLLFSLFNVTIALDFAKIAPLTFKGIVAAITWPKVAIGVLQTIVLFWMFRLVGKKFT